MQCVSALVSRLVLGRLPEERFDFVVLTGEFGEGVCPAAAEAEFVEWAGGGEEDGYVFLFGALACLEVLDAGCDLSSCFSCVVPR